MVQVLIYPSFEKTEVTKIDYETMSIEFATSKGQRDRPAMAVNEGTVAGMSVLTMGKRNIRVDFAAGKHDLLVTNGVRNASLGKSLATLDTSPAATTGGSPTNIARPS